MIPIVTPDEMAAHRRRRARARRGADRAGRCRGGPRRRRGCWVARTAAACVVLAGQGQQRRRRAGRGATAGRAGAACVRVVDAADAPRALPAADLVIDAAYGTGFRGHVVAARRRATPPVLAVDIPSGVDGADRRGRRRRAAAPTDGDVRGAEAGPAAPPGRGRCAGDVEVADIGLDVSRRPGPTCSTEATCAWLAAAAAVDAHKWHAAVWVVAGSPGMTGAARLVDRGRHARRGRRWSGSRRPVSRRSPAVPTEVVGRPLPPTTGRRPCSMSLRALPRARRRARPRAGATPRPTRCGDARGRAPVPAGGRRRRAVRVAWSSDGADARAPVVAAPRCSPPTTASTRLLAGAPPGRRPDRRGPRRWPRRPAPSCC